MQFCLTQKSQKVSFSFLFCQEPRTLSKNPEWRPPKFWELWQRQKPVARCRIHPLNHSWRPKICRVYHSQHAQIIIFIGCADVALCNLLYSCLLLQLCLVLFYTPATTSDCQSLKTMSKTFVPIRPAARKEAIWKKLKPWRWIWRKSWKLSSQSLVSFPNSRTFVKGK